MLTIGVLGLQGGVAEHISMLKQIDYVNAVIVKTRKDLEKIDGLIIPGGESTAMGKLLEDFKLLDVLADNIHKGLPVWGTCAGMILLAKKVSNYDQTYLNVMDIQVRRNAYGSQLYSFQTKIMLPDISNGPIPLVFIRAPYVEKVWNDVKIVAELDGKIIACKQKNMLATSFHPELTGDLSFHQYFINALVNKNSFYLNTSI